MEIKYLNEKNAKNIRKWGFQALFTIDCCQFVTASTHKETTKEKNESWKPLSGLKII